MPVVSEQKDDITTDFALKKSFIDLETIIKLVIPLTF
jgi:hypothetical protein